MLTRTRQATILQRVNEAGEASVSDLATTLQVSPSTIRRDLNALSAEGLLRRVRGGGSIETDDNPFHIVAEHARTAKGRLAKSAAELVSDGDVVVIDIGTTTALIARELRGKPITVITSSLAVVDELRDDNNVELVVLGGVLRRSYHSLVGSLTESALSQLLATICFLGTSGVRADGTVMDSTGIEVPVKRAILASSTHVVLVADETKFPGTGILPVCPATEINTLVTSTRADSATLEVFRQSGSDVILE